MSQFDKQRERPFQLLLFIFSLLGSALAWLVPLLSREQVFSPFQSGAITVFLALCLFTILVIIVPPIFRWAQRVVCYIKTRKSECTVLRGLNVLVDELNELFDPNLTHSLLYLIRDLSSIYIKNREIHSQLKVISEKLNILSDWSGLLVDSLKKPGIIHEEHRFQSTIHDVTRFHYSLGDVVRELNAIDLFSDSNRPRNKQTEGIVVGKYNHFISRLEETINSANKLGTNLPSPNFTRLELK